jgi:hypothetical protein
MVFDSKMLPRNSRANAIVWLNTQKGHSQYEMTREKATMSAKEEMDRVLQGTKLPFEELQVFLTDIERIVNTRPLIPYSNVPEDIRAKTPNTLRRRSDEQLESTNDLLHNHKKWRPIRALLERFWKQWSTRHLQSITTIIPKHTR